MKAEFEIGATKHFEHKVTAADTARFESGEVHAVYSTFALARDAEWSGRLFVLDLLEENEEGIGTHISVNHLAPAFVDETVTFTAILIAINKNEIVSSFQAKVKNRIVAEGLQKQKIVNKIKLAASFSSLKKN